MQVLGLIPARMASSRFPGKPLTDILGKPMIGHVFERVSEATSLDSVAVATCDLEIVEYIESIGGRAIWTSARHERASDRCAEALQEAEREDGTKYDAIVMIQGDEPMVTPSMVEEALAPMLEDPTVQVINLMAPITSPEELASPNCIKVVTDLAGRALYFSRLAIPFTNDHATQFGKQVCIIPFRRDFLLRYTEMDPTPLEHAESIDMLRVLEHGEDVWMVPTDRHTHAVDTPEDVGVVEHLIANQN